MSEAASRRVEVSGNNWRENSARVQEALDKTSSSGGGRVVVATGAGGAEIGHVHLPSYVELELEPGSTLYAAQAREAYEASSYGCLIESHETRSVSLTGRGVIDGRAHDFMEADLTYIYQPTSWRPRLVAFFGSEDVTIRDITLRNAPSWTIHPIGCRRVLVEGITIDNDLKVPNCDGIDPDHCQDLRIANCSITAADDCIVLKTTKEFADYGACERITVNNCTLTSTSAAFKIGSESVSDFRDIIVNGCTITRSNRGLAIQLRDQGNVEHVTLSNCVVQTRLFEDHYWGKAEPLYITATQRFGQAEDALPDWNPTNELGTVRDVSVSNLEIRSENGAVLYGAVRADGSHTVQNIRLRDLDIRVQKQSRWPAGRRDLRPCDTLGPAFRDPGKDPGLEDLPHSAISAERIEDLSIDGATVQWAVTAEEGYGDPLFLRRNKYLRVNQVSIREVDG